MVISKIRGHKNVESKYVKSLSVYHLQGCYADFDSV